MADLEMKDCDFEKGARAEILFDKGGYGNGHIFRHLRTKIFTDAGVNKGDVKLTYFGDNITDFKAETINLVDGKIVYIPVDKKQVYTQKIDHFRSSLVFAFPDVKPGSIIEYEFGTESGPDWAFQSDIPTRYSEINADFPADIEFNYISHISHPFLKNIGESYSRYQDKVLTNIHSLPDEPYMGARKDNLERMEFLGTFYRVQSWQKIGELLLEFDEFGKQLSWNLTGEDLILQQAKALPSRDEKISFIFNAVKNNMKWNGVTTFGTSDGTVRAWDKKTGNSAEINFALYDLLHKAGIDAYPMLTSTKEHGKLNPFFATLFAFNNVEVYIPSDTASNYLKDIVLDATNKYNQYNIIPKDNLNTFGVVINKKTNKHKTVFMEDTDPEIQSVNLNVEIKPDGKMVGNAVINCNSYYKIDEVTKYKTDGEEKFIGYLADNNNSLKIQSLKIENTDVDTLPLVKTVNFTLDLGDADNNYIYFNPNLFITPRSNPFLSETRYTDIDFLCPERTLISGTFKLPAGYKVDAMPKSTALTMPDKGIIFRRIINQDDTGISIRYTIVFNKTLYSKDDYPYLRDFYKQLYEMLNEQIVLKKS
jgi:hypothetical protein